MLVKDDIASDIGERKPAVESYRSIHKERLFQCGDDSGPAIQANRRRQYRHRRVPAELLLHATEPIGERRVMGSRPCEPDPRKRGKFK
jgi:hypothetical protein